MNYRILCVFAKEFESYFRSRLAYFVLVIYTALSLALTFYSSGYFELDNRSLFSLFYFQPEVLTLIIPALTMKLWADERRYGTLELLLAQPVSYTVLTLGKFFAAWLFCLLLLSMTIPLWIYTSQILPLDHLHIAWSYVGVWLAAGALCAIGCAVSAFNANPVSAYLVTVFICWIIKLSNFEWLLRAGGFSNQLLLKIANSLSFDQHYADIISGRFDLAGFAYFLSLILLSLWLNVVAVSYKRS